MSFSIENKNIKNNYVSLRAFHARPTYPPICVLWYTDSRKRASFFLFLKIKNENRRGSLTAETAVVLPLFLFLMVWILYFFIAVQLQTDIQSALHETGKDLAHKAYLIGLAGDMSEDIPVGGFTYLYAAEKVKQLLNKNKLGSFCIKGGSSGMTFLLSSFLEKEDSIDIVVNYRFEFPIHFPGITGFWTGQRAKMKAWTGMGEKSEEQEEMVYITENGTVYHKTMQCTYIKLSVKQTNQNMVGALRNIDGGKYYPCEKCIGNATNATVYITHTGDRFHGSPSCSGLKRTVKTVPISEVKGRVPCSRCGKGS